jgi:bifunctional DNase/RNase
MTIEGAGEPAGPGAPADVAPEDLAPGDDTRAEDAPAGTAPAEDAPGAEVVPEPESWRIVRVADVRLDLPAANPEVVLQESDAPWRELRIPVGMAEGTAIAYALRGVDSPRPLTHALVTELLERQGVALVAARITGRQGRLFAAELETTGPKGRQVVQCRPSDAIALVLRQPMPTPLLAGEWVFDNSSGG